MAQRIRIVSDGNTASTSVMVDDQVLVDVVSVVWTAAMDERGQHTLCTAVLTIENVPVEITGYAESA